LWQFHLIERFDGGSAVVVRIHHCYADGIADPGDARQPTPIAPAMPQARCHLHRAQARPTIRLPSRSARLLTIDLQFARQAGSTLIEKGVGLWHDPGRAVALAEQGAALTTEIVRLATMGEDSATRFKGKPGIAKRVAWADPVPLAEVKAIGRAYDCSINDVLLSSVAGALRRTFSGMAILDA
jgi:hypothetical protein